jgi:hypothetical protein
MLLMFARGTNFFLEQQLVNPHVMDKFNVPNLLFVWESNCYFSLIYYSDLLSVDGSLPVD